VHVCVYACVLRTCSKQHSHLTVNEDKSAGKTDNREHTFLTKLDLL